MDRFIKTWIFVRLCAFGPGRPERSQTVEGFVRRGQLSHPHQDEYEIDGHRAADLGKLDLQSRGDARQQEISEISRQVRNCRSNSRQPASRVKPTVMLELI